MFFSRCFSRDSGQKLTSVSDLQLAKHSDPILSTLAGTEILIIPELSNAFSPMIFSSAASPNVTSIRAVDPVKHDAPILSTPTGIEILTRPEHLNAFGPMVFSSDPSQNMASLSPWEIERSGCRRYS